VVKNGSLLKPESDTTLLDLKFFKPQTIPEQARRDSIAFWQSENVLPENVAQQRAPQVVGHAYLANTLVGIASGYVNVAPTLRQPYFHYRTYVAQRHRRGGIAQALLAFNFTQLANYFSAQPSPAAVGVILEIPATIAPLDDHLVWPQTKFSFAGTTSEGAHMRVRYFEQVKLKPATT